VKFNENNIIIQKQHSDRIENAYATTSSSTQLHERITLKFCPNYVTPLNTRTLEQKHINPGPLSKITPYHAYAFC